MTPSNLRRDDAEHRNTSYTRSLRFYLKQLCWMPEYLTYLGHLKSKYTGQRAFLVASGPSLSSMDLSVLKDEFVCVVNMAVRLVGRLLPQANIHIVVDSRRYTKFAAEIETICRDHEIELRFLNWSCKNHWRSLDGPRASRPRFVLLAPYSPDALPQFGPLSDLSRGLRGGSSVVIAATQILFWLGFREVYVIGCDLDYDQDVKYAYTMDEIDVAHYSSVSTFRRDDLERKTNRDFAVLYNYFTAKGKLLANAGVGGRLSTLPRTDFENLFDRISCSHT